MELNYFNDSFLPFLRLEIIFIKSLSFVANTILFNKFLIEYTVANSQFASFFMKSIAT